MSPYSTCFLAWFEVEGCLLWESAKHFILVLVVTIAVMDLFDDTAAILNSVISSSCYGMFRGHVHSNLPSLTSAIWNIRIQNGRRITLKAHCEKPIPNVQRLLNSVSGRSQKAHKRTSVIFILTYAIHCSLLQLTFEGIRGSNYQGDAAIDDIIIFDC